MERIVADFLLSPSARQTSLASAINSALLLAESDPPTLRINSRIGRAGVLGERRVAEVDDRLGQGGRGRRGRQAGHSTGGESKQAEIEPTLGIVTALPRREAVANHPDQGAGLVELLATRALVAQPVLLGADPGVVEWFGTRTDHRGAPGEADAVPAVPPRVGGIEEPEIVLSPQSSRVLRRALPPTTGSPRSADGPARPSRGRQKPVAGNR